jgi:hypothetical protein
MAIEERRPKYMKKEPREKPKFGGPFFVELFAVLLQALERTAQDDVTGAPEFAEFLEGIGNIDFL